MSGRSPQDYRPDLRPMLILLGLLIAVVLGWLVLSPLILPPRPLTTPDESAPGAYFSAGENTVKSNRPTERYFSGPGK